MRYQPGDILNGKYRIVELIGGGAMGEVYRAEHLTIKKLVAIKIMHGEQVENSESIMRFRREAQAAAMLDHSNICAVTDFDTTERGDFYLVMELLIGETLKLRLKREGKFDPINAVWIMHQLLSALQCAHSHGLVHRDVKPDNIILIQREGRNDFVKLIDFGIAHQDNPEGDSNELTQAGQIFGTPQYLSPEQALGDPIDFHADLYASGIILYEMLVGVPPFNGTNYIELLHKQISELPPHLPENIDDFEDLDAVIQVLLQKSPSDRYGSADEVISALDEIILNSHSSSASPDAMALKASIAGASINRNIQSLSMSVAKLNEEGSEQIIQSTGKIQALLESNSHILAAIPGKWYQNRQKLIVVILVGIIVIILAILLVVLIQVNQEDTDIDQEEPRQIVVNNVDELKEARAQINVAKVEPLPFNYTESACNVAFDDILSMNQSLVVGTASCLQKHYEEAGEIFESLKDEYWHHPNFLRVYLMTMHALKKREETLAAAEQLLKLVPDAGCNPSVRNVFYALLDDGRTLEKLKLIFMNSDNPKIPEAVGWLILNTPCNRYAARFDALVDIYDNLSHENVPKYLDDSVNQWQPFKKGANCATRQEVIDEIMIKAARDLCVGDKTNPDGMDNPDSGQSERADGKTQELAENAPSVEGKTDSVANDNARDSEDDSENSASKPLATCPSCMLPWYEKALKAELEPPPAAPSAKSAQKNTSKSKGTSRTGKNGSKSSDSSKSSGSNKDNQSSAIRNIMYNKNKAKK